MLALDRLEEYSMNSIVRDHMVCTLEEYKEYIYSLYSRRVQRIYIFFRKIYS